MDDRLQARAILSLIQELAEHAADAPAERLCIALANLLENPDIQADEKLFSRLVSFGAALWRHTGEFRGGGSRTVQ